MYYFYIENFFNWTDNLIQFKSESSVETHIDLILNYLMKKLVQYTDNSELSVTIFKVFENIFQTYRKEIAQNNCILLVRDLNQQLENKSKVI